MSQIRGVFPLPLTSPQISGVDQVVELGSGGVYVIPPGNFLVHTGPVTMLQWFDPGETVWRPVFPHQAMGYLSCDGTNYRLINMSGVVQGAMITAPGTGGTNGIGPVQTGTTIGFTPSPLGAPGQADGFVIIGGSVPAPQLVQGGSRYLVAPLVCCDPPPVGGRQATFTATIDATGAITAVTLVDGGAGYTSPPQFYIIPQPKYYQGAPRWPLDPPLTPWPAPGTINPANVWPGTVYQPNIEMNGALIISNALTGSGTVTGIVINFNGAGYTGAGIPTITFTGGPLTGAAATAVMALSLIGPTIALGGTSTAGAPFTAAGGAVAPGFAQTVPGGGVFADAAGNLTVTNPGFGFQAVPVGPTGTAIPAASVGGVDDTSHLQGAVN